jgi:hypothetical protein
MIRMAGPCTFAPPADRTQNTQKAKREEEGKQQRDGEHIEHQRKL